MKIEFLSQNDAVYILPFFEEFLRHYPSEFEILQISCCPVMGNRPRRRLLKELIALYGPLGFSRMAVREAASRVLGRLPAALTGNRYYSLEQLCASRGIPFQRIGNPNNPDFVQSLRRRAPDAIVSVACPYILKSPLLKAAPLGCINIHHAPLPRYQGMMPTFWQLYSDEKAVGVTVHYMAEKVDAGPVLLQEYLDVVPGETLDHLIIRSKRHGAHCMARVLRQVARHDDRAAPLEAERATYFTFPTIEQIREFRRRGLRAI